VGKAELSAGPIHYEDSGGDGQPLVLIHGLAMDGRVFDDTVAALTPAYRCIRPTFPLGSHREPMRADADLSLRGQARLIAELIESLQLDGAALCFNDWSCGQVMVADGLLDRVDALIFGSCETEHNYPPGLGGKAAVLSAKLPGGFSVMRQVLLRRSLRRLPFIYGQMSKHGIPDPLMRDWLEPLGRAEIQRDVRKYVGDVRRGSKAMKEATPALGDWKHPVLVVWDSEGKMMPNEEGRRLAEAFPSARYVEIEDSYTLIPIDQPQRLAAEIRHFLG
jgi:pimeloyl-ACP methyl ester carboxylesterase